MPLPLREALLEVAFEDLAFATLPFVAFAELLRDFFGAALALAACLPASCFVAAGAGG